jgi:hypothetical protein
MIASAYDLLPIRAHPRSRCRILLLLVATACGDGDSVGPGPDETRPTVTSTVPAGGATDADVAGAVTATFSEAMDPATLTATTFTVSGGVTGTVSYAGQTATFTPSAALSAGTTYTATITTDATDLAGNGLAQDHSWTFATAAPAVPAVEFPLAAGKRWRYQGLDSTIIVAASTGIDKVRFSGEYFVHIEGEEQWEGRSAWRTTVYKLAEIQTGEPALSVEVEHLFQGPEGLERWFATGDGGNWRTILSRTSAAYGNSTFLLVDGPTHEDDMSLSPASVTVPAGSYSTVQALHEYRETGQFATRDIFETRTEDYANAVGLVAGRWDYSFDDNDPAAADIVSKGEILLTHIDNGPFPDFVAELEPNDASATATTASAIVLLRGGTAIADAGTILTDAEVGCTQQCIFPNKNGEKRIQDWYRLTLTAPRTVNIDLTYETFTGGSFNDLDLYAFAEQGTGLQFLGSSLGEQGEPEGLFGPLNAGTYYLAVQAWDTPSGRVGYWMSVR